MVPTSVRIVPPRPPARTDATRAAQHQPHHVTTLILYTLFTDVITDFNVCKNVVDISQRHMELFDTTSQ